MLTRLKALWRRLNPPPEICRSPCMGSVVDNQIPHYHGDGKVEGNGIIYPAVKR